ncbi:MAG: hypothetical protein ACR2F1_03845 [Nitrososphaeraceae archaeon]
MSEESDTKNLKTKAVKEVNIENTNDIPSNIKILNDKFNTMCLNYVQSISDIQTEYIKIIENTIKANNRIREENMTNYSKIFAINQDLCMKLTKDWLSIYTKNNS